uniref:Uncharacterized protein n=1 Tax=Populus trichocarpa TaxID=3694 RepID=A9PIA3_POPTR|nr:unknown [Populus trichocarpa]
MEAMRRSGRFQVKLQWSVKPARQVCCLGSQRGRHQKM